MASKIVYETVARAIKQAGKKYEGHVGAMSIIADVTWEIGLQFKVENPQFSYPAFAKACGVAFDQEERK